MISRYVPYVVLHVIRVRHILPPTTTLQLHTTLTLLFVDWWRYCTRCVTLHSVTLLMIHVYTLPATLLRHHVVRSFFILPWVTFTYRSPLGWITRCGRTRLR